ncbi:membrane protein [Rhodobacter phage RcDurkin]|nr:membrane protein [Rhodobacter phage RcDurkin]UUV43750.1 membrane protein [Rhodobacter phage RcKickapoo]UUV44377.1 membrane protein [Rhodobacter phage RcMenchie]
MIVTASIVIIFYVTIIIGIGLYHYMGAYNG